MRRALGCALLIFFLILLLRRFPLSSHRNHGYGILTPLQKGTFFPVRGSPPFLAVTLFLTLFAFMLRPPWVCGEPLHWCLIEPKSFLMFIHLGQFLALYNVPPLLHWYIAPLAVPNIIVWKPWIWGTDTMPAGPPPLMYYFYHILPDVYLPGSVFSPLQCSPFVKSIYFDVMTLTCTP